MNIPSNELTEELEILLAGYVLGDLTQEETTKVNQTLKFNPELVLEVNRLKKTLAILTLSLTETSPPKSLRSKILKQI